TVCDEEPSSYRVRLDCRAPPILRSDDASVESCRYFGILQVGQTKSSGDHTSAGDSESASATSFKLIVPGERIEEQDIAAPVILQTDIEDCHRKTAISLRAPRIGRHASDCGDASRKTRP